MSYQRYSFDVFDTLIARRCIEPHNVFAEIARECRVSEFPSARIESERLLADRNYSIQDIYNNLSNLLPFRRETTMELMQLEIEMEKRNVLPILTNQELVQDGDVLISDMYLTPSTILSLLEQSGFHRHVSLVVTSHGKRRGHVWPTVSRDFGVSQHLGDNSISDYEQPIRNGIFGRLDTTARLTSSEELLRQAGFEQLSRFARELRLAVASRSLGYERYCQQSLQLSYNIPMLILIAVHIQQLVKQYTFDRVFFSSRDCYYLYRLFRELFSESSLAERSEYFYTSRFARVTSSNSVIEALRARFTERSLVVDICGSGWSLSQLYSSIGFEPFTFFVHGLHNSADIVEGYRSLKESVPLKKVLCITASDELKNITLEVLNYVRGGMVLSNDYLGSGSGNFLRQEEPRYPREVLGVIDEIEKCQVTALRLLRNYDLGVLTEEVSANRDKLRSVILSLYEGAQQRLSCMKDVCDYHASQGDATTEKLNRLKVSEND